MTDPRRRAQNGPMDVKRISAADWLMIGGAVSTFVFGLFLDWAQYGHASGNNAFDYFLTGGIAWILAVAVGIVAFLLASGQMRPDGRPWPLIETVASMLAAVLMLVRLATRGRVGEGVERREHGHDRSAPRRRHVAHRALRRGGGDRCRPRSARRARPGRAENLSTVKGFRLGGQSLATMPAISSPASVGLSPTCTPAARKASILPCAVPVLPDTMAPAWPIFRPAGAVTPAM